MNVIADQRYLVALLAIVTLTLLLLAVRAHRDQHSTIDLTDLIKGTDGRIAKDAVLMMTAYGVMLWMMVYLTLSGKMTEGYFTSFGALAIAPFIARLLKSDPAPLPPKE